MKSNTSTKTSHQYRLRAEIESQARVYTLGVGENRLGNSSVNDVVIPVREVSRQHALLRVADEELWLEDLGSKNGTLVNGARITRARLADGDRLQLGPCELRLEKVETADLELGLVLEASPEGTAGGSSRLRTRSTHRVIRAAAEPALLGLVEQVVTCLALQENALGDVMVTLVEALRVAGACLAEWPDRRQSAVLAAFGAVEELSELALLAAIGERELGLRDPAGSCRAGWFAVPAPMAYAFLDRPDGGSLSLMVWGERVSGGDHEALLRIVVRLLDFYLGKLPTRSARTAASGIAVLDFPAGYVPGRSPAMRRFYAAMQPLLGSDLPVLIEGETGVGKEYVARILHRSSQRRSGPFIAVNCAAIPADLLEAEMFGIGEGVATGVRGRRGKIQLAEGGTLFLDEIGDMSPELQAKLLRALQEKEVHPVGGATERVDVRVLAATNLNLLREVDEQRFRRDLYYRVAGSVLRVPPLRQRVEDLTFLLEHFLHAGSRDTGKTVRGVSVKALDALRRYPWPGNIRELENEVERLVHLCPDGHAIDSTMLTERLVAARHPDHMSSPDEAQSLLLSRHVEATERRIIALALDQAGGSQRKATELLGISRNGLTQKMKRLGLLAKEEYSRLSG